MTAATDTPALILLRPAGMGVTDAHLRPAAEREAMLVTGVGRAAAACGKQRARGRRAAVPAHADRRGKLRNR